MSKKEGGAEVSFEGDLVRMSFWGHISEAIAKDIMVKQLEYSNGRPYLMSLVDLRRFESVSPEARKIFAEAAQRAVGRGSALYGASFQARIIATLIMKAANIFSKQENPSYFCATEAEGLAWIESRRRELQKEGTYA